MHYPATTAANEWANEILALDQLVIEGFRPRELRTLARKLGRTLQPAWGSLKLLEECLIGSGVDDDDAREAVSPLRLLHEHRNALKGHAATEKRAALEKKAKTAFATFRAHFTDLPQASTAPSN